MTLISSCLFQGNIRKGKLTNSFLQVFLTVLLFGQKGAKHEVLIGIGLKDK